MAAAEFANPVIDAIVRFLREIGLEVRTAPIDPPTALPGIDIEHGALVVDEARLLYPGDLLHEAGHLAVVLEERRAAFHHDAGNDPAEEMLAIAWSYAAALHLGIDPAVVLHDGYQANSASILKSFSEGHYFAVELLALYGMTYAGKHEPPSGARSYPAMSRWLRK